MREPGIRHTRIEELILEELESIVPFEMSDPRAVECQVTRVQLSADMRDCKVFVVAAGGAPAADSLAILNHAASFIRYRISENLGLKHTPRFQFFYDDTVEKVRRLESIFQDLHRPGTEPPDEAI